MRILRCPTIGRINFFKFLKKNFFSRKIFLKLPAFKSFKQNLVVFLKKISGSGEIFQFRGKKIFSSIKFLPSRKLFNGWATLITNDYYYQNFLFFFQAVFVKRFRNNIFDVFRINLFIVRPAVSNLAHFHCFCKNFFSDESLTT